MLWFCVALLVSCMSAAVGYDLGVAAIFQDEAPYLREWIEFHKLQGVDHFWLYNNNSSDDYEHILKPYMRSGTVELIDWPSDSHDFNTHSFLTQPAAYNDALLRAQGTAWLALIDTDEFLFSPTFQTLPTVLQDYADYGSVNVNWQCFGTSGVRNIPSDKPMIEVLLHKRSPYSALHYTTKAIVQPSRVAHFNNPHAAVLKEGFLAVNTVKYVRGAKGFGIHLNHMRINHYTVRDEDYLHRVKIPRQKAWGNNEETVLEYADSLNEVVDTTILHWLPDLRRALDLPRSAADLSRP